MPRGDFAKAWSAYQKEHGKIKRSEYAIIWRNKKSQETDFPKENLVS